MEWYNILVLIVGAFGGVGGFVSIYNAKSNKDSIDIKNFHSLLEEERTERSNLSQEYHQYKEEVENKVASVKMEFEELKSENQKMLKSIYQAYRCRLPEKMHECPVIAAFNNDCVCDVCKHDINENE